MTAADTLIINCATEADTDQLGRALGLAVEPGLVVALTGNLGAGKTRLVQAAAAALQVEDQDVSSPTFVLIREYNGTTPVYHFDTYRLRDLDEFLELGADEYMHGDGVCFIEWAERMAEALPRDRLSITIEVTSPASRRFHVVASGARSSRVLARLQQFNQAAADTDSRN